MLRRQRRWRRADAVAPSDGVEASEGGDAERAEVEEEDDLLADKLIEDCNVRVVRRRCRRLHRSLPCNRHSTTSKEADCEEEDGEGESL